MVSIIDIINEHIEYSRNTDINKKSFIKKVLGNNVRFVIGRGIIIADAIMMLTYLLGKRPYVEIKAKIKSDDIYYIIELKIKDDQLVVYVDNLKEDINNIRYVFNSSDELKYICN